MVRSPEGDMINQVWELLVGRVSLASRWLSSEIGDRSALTSRARITGKGRVLEFT
jgi:hypothetical protein